MLLFGGCSSGFGPCSTGDLGTFDLKTNVWTELKPTGDAPSARSNPALVFDPNSKRMLLFGGNLASGQANDGSTLDVTKSQWAKISFDGAAPSPRRSHDAIVDSAKGRVLMSGGTGAEGNSDELWELKL